jgi:hypothetical protein
VITSFGHQEGAEVGLCRRFVGRRETLESPVIIGV